ncbi:MAG TPA: sugar phosphate nucleotidyltransferase [Anaerolineales bacterium]|nr:sugar phosphate nucleotidyltransferase [Anaerolineales bacterium]
MSDIYALVMAGGGGTRLWPLSRLDRPKQLLRLLGDRSLFQMAIDRLTPWLPAEHILVAAPEDMLPSLREQAVDRPGLSYLAEPAAKGTAAVIGLAASVLARTNPESIMVCVTADHYIGRADRLRELLAGAVEAATTGALVTLGVPPTYADTGYGYIEAGESLGTFRGVEARRVLHFTEKPAPEIAQGYVQDGRHTWNSGMFVWRVERLLEEIDRWMPDLRAALTRIDAASGTPGADVVLRKEWSSLAPQTIDYGVMEHAENVAVVMATDLMWADIGSWDRLYELRHRDADGNAVEAPASLVVDSHGVLLLGQERGPGEKPKLVALIGAEDLIVVDTPDALLVCPRDRAAEVRELVERLREHGMDSYLVWET